MSYHQLVGYKEYLCYESLVIKGFANMRHSKNMIFSGRYFIEYFLKSPPALGNRVFASCREPWVPGDLVKNLSRSCFILSDKLRHGRRSRCQFDRRLYIWREWPQVCVDIDRPIGVGCGCSGDGF